MDIMEAVSVLWEKPLVGVIVITIAFALILEMTMMKKKPSIANDSFDSVIGDLAFEGEKEKPKKKVDETETVKSRCSPSSSSHAVATSSSSSSSSSPSSVKKNGTGGDSSATAKKKEVVVSEEKKMNGESKKQQQQQQPKQEQNPKSASGNLKKKENGSTTDDRALDTGIVEDDDGPFRIGDRVVLKGFKNASKGLNRRHGVVAGIRDKKNNNRYPVDLDLFSFPSSIGGSTAGTKSSVFVKEDNMVNEKSIPECTQRERAGVVNGCLDKNHGMVCAFLITQMRNIITNTLKGNEPNASKRANWGWKYWSTPNGKQGVYASLCRFMKVDLLRNPNTSIEKIEKQLNPKHPEGTFKFLQDAIDDERAVKGWNVRIQGDFWVVHIDANGTYVIPCDNTRTVYLVVGYQIPLGKQFLELLPRPPKLRLTLLPWFGRIIHDPIVAFTTGTNQIQMASINLTTQLQQSWQLAVSQNRVISRFAQLEVSTGSKQGLPFVEPPKATKQDVASEDLYTPPEGGGPTGIGGPVEPQAPPTKPEKILMEAVSRFPTFPLPPPPQVQQKEGQAAFTDENKMGMWNFVRKGNGPSDNPKNEGVIINAQGHNIATFTYVDANNPTAEDVIRAMLGLVKHLGKRPAIMGIDATPQCVARLQYLFMPLKGTKVLGLNVQRTPVQHQNNANASGMAAGPGGPMMAGGMPSPEEGGLGAMAIPPSLLKTK